MRDCIHVAVLAVVVAAGTILTACGGIVSDPAGPAPTSSTSEGLTSTTLAAAPPPAAELDPAAEPDPSTEPVLVTPCFTTGPELVLPDNWIAADVSAGDDTCLFVLQAENLADTTAIAGELFVDRSGRPFEDAEGQLELELAAGQEPDILALQLLNTGASGRDLPILERIELEAPNRAVILVHESDRRDGFFALSAVIEVPSESDPSVTWVMRLWGLLLPMSHGTPEQSINYQLTIDLINSMQFVPR